MGAVQRGPIAQLAGSARSFATEEGSRVLRKPEGTEQHPAKRPQLAEYEQALRTSMRTPSLEKQAPDAAGNVGTPKAGNADILPRVKLERFLKRMNMPSASFSYIEERDAPSLPPEEVICTVRASGRVSKGRGTSRFDATQQACHQWIDDYMDLHKQEKRMRAKTNPTVKDLVIARRMYIQFTVHT